MSKSNDIQTTAQLAAKKKVERKKKKKIVKTVIIILIIAAALIFILSKLGIIGKNDHIQASNLTTYTVGTRSITQVLSGSGTIEPNDQYTINALVSGEIISDYFDEGDTVTEDQLLYKFDSDNLNSSVTRANNSLKNANSSLNDALENLEKLNVESDVSGTVKKLYVEIGDEINAGTLIADVIDNDIMCIDIPFMSVDCPNISIGDKATLTFDNYEETAGEVTEISPITSVNNLGVSVQNVTISVKNTGSITTATRAFAQIDDIYCTADGIFYNNDEGQIYSEIGGEVTRIYYDEGDFINDGQVIIRLESEDLEEQIDKLRDAVEEAEDSVDDANDAYDNYNIEAPITGKVISKSYKSGDTISGGQNGSSTLAVIYDMSALKFTMSIDELDIDKLDKGQDVVVTCDSREGEEYHGTITNISIQGTTTSGTTVYPVEVTIENIEDIDKRTVSEDGTINKVYKTGMTSTEKTYALAGTESSADGTVYVYSNDIKITRDSNGNLYDGDKLLKTYLGGTYTQGSYFYSFGGNFSSLTLEIQNDKKMLRPGMNVDAEIIVEKRENAVAVPLSAVARGNVVKVLKNTATTVKDNSDANSNFSENNKNTNNAEEDRFNTTETEFKDIKQQDGNTFGGYGTADANSEYEEIRVTVGISDDNYVEITSGLEEGDIVIVDNSNLASDSGFMAFGMMGGMGNMGDGAAMMGGGMPGGMGARPMGI